MRIGIMRCSHCGLPVLDAHAVLRRERRLVEQMLKENEAFRQSLSDEIYESFNQQLVAALLHFQGFEHLQRENPAEAQQVFRMAMELLRETLVQARRIANMLKPPVRDDYVVFP